MKLKYKFKKLVAITLCAAICTNASFAVDYIAPKKNVSDEEDAKIKFIISQTDSETLLQAALRNEIDYSVPESIREDIDATASFVPSLVPLQENNPVDLKVSTTVQKLGEVEYGDSTAAVYAAAAVSSSVPENVTEDYWTEYLGGVQAWAIVYWYDRPGTNNQLYGASGQWSPGDKVIRNRTVAYGTSDPLGLTWTNGPVTRTTNLNRVDYLDDSFWGLTFRCVTTCEVVNIGTLRVNVHS